LHPRPYAHAHTPRRTIAHNQYSEAKGQREISSTKTVERQLARAIGRFSTSNRWSLPAKPVEQADTHGSEDAPYFTFPKGIVRGNSDFL
jgi:hypothetical protein